MLNLEYYHIPALVPAKPTIYQVPSLLFLLQLYSYYRFSIIEFVYTRTWFPSDGGLAALSEVGLSGSNNSNSGRLVVEETGIRGT